MCRYGASTGVPSERDTYADIEAVYHYIESLGVDPADNIILYGQSVGTGPSCHLAARKPVRGLVLHSPMVTGIRVISNDNSVCAPASIFRSCDLVCGRETRSHTDMVHSGVVAAVLKSIIE